MSRIVALETSDIRFPTSLSLDGSDAMNPDPDYSAAYVIVRTDAADGIDGHAHHPSSTVAVLDESDTEPLADMVDELLDTGGADAAHGGIGQRGEGPGGAGHRPTVSTTRRAPCDPPRDPPRFGPRGALGGHAR